MATSWWKQSACIIASCIALLPLGCGSERPTEPAATEPTSPTPQLASEASPLAGTASLLVVTGLTVDADGNTVIPEGADPSTRLYYRRTNLPVLAPDGHHVTAGEFSAVRGSISVKCLESGTHISLHLRNLIANATYRVWLLIFEEPGFDLGPPPDFSNLIGEGALGKRDRSRNTFTASATGEGQITRIHPAGLLSERLPEPPFANEPVGACLLNDQFEWHVVAAFQQPGQPLGRDVGPPALFPHTAVEQFTFNFR
jgi:hypothetical protein